MFFELFLKLKFTDKKELLSLFNLLTDIQRVRDRTVCLSSFFTIACFNSSIS